MGLFSKIADPRKPMVHGEKSGAFHPAEQPMAASVVPTSGLARRLARKLARFPKDIPVDLHRARSLAASLRTGLQLNLLKARLRRQGRRLLAINMTEHMGDIIACEPVARHVRKEHPDDYIVWTVKSRYVDLVTHHPAIDRVVPVHCLTEWIRLRRRGIFDEVFDLHTPGRSCEVCRVALQKAEGDRQITLENYYEHGSLLSAFSRSAGLPSLSGKPELHIPDSVRQKVDALKLPEEFIAVHCKSIETERDWDKERWIELIALIRRELRCPVIELGLIPVLSESGKGVRNLCSRLELLETAEVIARASLFVGIDSGLAHMANAAAVPGVILLGHYRRFKHYCPYSGGYGDGTNATVLHHGGPLSRMPVEPAWTAVRERWRPSGQSEAISKSL
jgi:ADP-heptose:LPS heptosyltransferase